MATVSPAPVEDELMLQVRQAPFQAKPGHETILCPVLAALYNNGDLDVDEKGFVTQSDLKKGLARLGLEVECRDGLAGILFPKKNAPERVSLFQLKQPHIEHKYSTMIRDPVIDSARFEDVIMRQAVPATPGEETKFYKLQLKKAMDYAQTTKETKNDYNKEGGDGMLISFGAMLEVFGRYEGDEAKDVQYMTEADLRAIFLESNYPQGWKPHRVSRKTIRHEIVSMKMSTCCCVVL
jgi:hypothetical protein